MLHVALRAPRDQVRARFLPCAEGSLIELCELLTSGASSSSPQQLHELVFGVDRKQQRHLRETVRRHTGMVQQYR